MGRVIYIFYRNSQGIKMTIKKCEEFSKRISEVSAEDKALFGKMNVSQMICHCTDQIRMSFGEIDGLKIQKADINEFREMAKRGETVPTVDGLNQVAGFGTKPKEFDMDKETLIAYLNKFLVTEEKYKFSFHPYFGVIDKNQWDRLMVYHLDHHLGQFGR
jgi:hypothetical protein